VSQSRIARSVGAEQSCRLLAKARMAGNVHVLSDLAHRSSSFRQYLPAALMKMHLRSMENPSIVCGMDNYMYCCKNTDNATVAEVTYAEEGERVEEWRTTEPDRV
jgi:hypothetical protein